MLLYLWAASQACRFFVEARRSGLLELLVTAPLNDRQIVHGQWRALLRLFGLPVALLLVVHMTASTLSQLGFQRVFTQASKMTSATFTNQSGALTNQTFAKDIRFIVWSRSKLRSCLREQATLNLGQPRFVAPLPLSVSGPQPPIIATVQ